MRGALRLLSALFRSLLAKPCLDPAIPRLDLLVRESPQARSTPSDRMRGRTQSQYAEVLAEQEDHHFEPAQPAPETGHEVSVRPRARIRSVPGMLYRWENLMREES